MFDEFNPFNTVVGVGGGLGLSGLSGLVGGGGFGGNLLGSLLAPPAPAVASAPDTLITPTEMPSPTDQRKTKRRAMAAQLARKGRASTILTANDDALGVGI